MRAPQRPNPTPLASPAVALGAARHHLRRYRFGRLAATLVLGIVVLGALQRADEVRADAESSWAATHTVWVTLASIEAGGVVDASRVAPRQVPASLVPEGAATDPVGQRARSALGAGEILVTARLSDASSAVAARTPAGWGTIAIGRGDDLFEIGDRLDLHHLVDGHRLTTAARVVSVVDGDLGVAIHPDDIGAVVRALGQAGVVPVLTG